METTVTPKGKGFLKVVGILMIIGAGYGLIMGLLSLFGLSAAKELYAGTGIEGYLTLIVVLALASAIIELIAGIVGIKFCARPDKAMICIMFGILTLAFAIADNIMSFAAGTSSITGIIISILLSIVLPVLYLIGAILNKKAA